MSASNSGFVGTKCRNCGKPLTDEEIHYYGLTCNNCEGERLDAIETWRRGGRNDYFDKLYG